MDPESEIIYINVMHYGNMITNGVSIIAAAFVVAIIVSAMLIDRKTMNRVSIRITLAISILDILRSVFHIVTYDIRLEGAAYIGQEFVYNFITLAYFFLNMSIAVNLQLIFMNGYSFNPFWERIYWAMSFGMAFLISLLIPVREFVGVEGTDDWREGDKVVKYIWDWSFMYFWILLAIVYCTVVVSLVIAKLIRNERNLSSVCEKGIVKASSWQSARCNTIIKSLICRISFYCAIPVVTHVALLGHEINAVFTQEKYWLVTLRVITGGFPGMLNFLAFIPDPAFRNALEAFEKHHNSASWEWLLQNSNEATTAQSRAYTANNDAITSFKSLVNKNSSSSHKLAQSSIQVEPTKNHDSVPSEHIILAPADSPAQLEAAEEQRFEDYVRAL